MKDYKIVVIESGYVYLCLMKKEIHPILGVCLKGLDARNIRRWGTTKGLGQLAILGKQPDTILDYTGVVTIPINKINHIIDVTEDSIKTLINEE